MIGQQISHYRIDRRLGEGGMGVVYAARDLDLDRDVALKVIRRDLTDPSLRERFRREARAAAALNHPNIGHLYEIREHEGELFITMELLEGETLADRLARGPLPLADAVRIGLAVLDALAAIHGRGMVHRDVKPSNVFLLSDGRVKLLDFGLALPALEPDETALTAAGSVMGSPRYMAPEQVRGQSVDARSDLFALGSLLYETVAGRPAFQGETPAETMVSVLRDPPEPLRGSGPVEALDAVVRRSLSKPATERFQTATEMRNALRQVPVSDTGERPAVGPSDPMRLAVLPFRLLRPEADKAFLSTSLADAIAMSLAGIRSLVVRSPAAAARFDGPSIDFRELGRALEVNVALTGTILPAGERYRVVAQLVDAPSGSVIWSQTTDVTTGDVFELQDTLTRRIVESLQLPLSARERSSLGSDVPASPAAYELFLRANQASTSVSFDLQVAHELYQRSLEADPSYAPTWARLGRCQRLIGKYIDPARKVEYYRRAEQSLNEALKLHPDLPMAHHYYSQLELDLGRPEPAIERMLEVVRRNPSDPEGYAGLVTAFRYVGLLEESMAAHERARQLSPVIPTSVHYTLESLHRYEDALNAYQQGAPRFRPRVLHHMGRHEEALAEARKWLSDEMPNPMGQLLRVARATLEDDRATALEMVEQLKDFPDPEGVTSILWACAQFDLDRAARMFDRLVDGYPNLALFPDDAAMQALWKRPDVQAARARAEERARAAAARWGGWRPAGER